MRSDHTILDQHQWPIRSVHVRLYGSESMEVDISETIKTRS